MPPPPFLNQGPPYVTCNRNRGMLRQTLILIFGRIAKTSTVVSADKTLVQIQILVRVFF